MRLWGDWVNWDKGKMKLQGWNVQESVQITKEKVTWAEEAIWAEETTGTEEA